MNKHKFCGIGVPGGGVVAIWGGNLYVVRPQSKVAVEVELNNAKLEEALSAALQSIIEHPSELCGVLPGMFENANRIAQV
jgi:hypothetical protein